MELGIAVREGGRGRRKQVPTFFYLRLMEKKQLIDRMK